LRKKGKYDKLRVMQEQTQYAECTKDELIRMLLDRDRTIEELKKELEGLKHPVPKDSTNSSMPTSKEMIPRTRSQREKSGKKSGGQVGHKGEHRERNPHADSIVVVEASHCTSCGASLEGIEGTIGQIAQQVDIPLITPLTTEYRQLIKVCACGACNRLPLPIEGYVNIGPQMGALITYLNVEHAIPYERLCQMTHDLLGFAIGDGDNCQQTRTHARAG
jgi:transposase